MEGFEDAGLLGGDGQADQQGTVEPAFAHGLEQGAVGGEGDLVQRGPAGGVDAGVAEFRRAGGRGLGVDLLHHGEDVDGEVVDGVVEAGQAGVGEVGVGAAVVEDGLEIHGSRGLWWVVGWGAAGVDVIHHPKWMSNDILRIERRISAPHRPHVGAGSPAITVANSPLQPPIKPSRKAHATAQIQRPPKTVVGAGLRAMSMGIYISRVDAQIFRRRRSGRSEACPRRAALRPQNHPARARLGEPVLDTAPAWPQCPRYSVWQV